MIWPSFKDKMQEEQYKQ